MEIPMSITTFTKTLALLVLALFIVAADDITRTLPDGTDVSALSCGSSIVFIGDRAPDVIEKCGEPITRTQFIDQPGDFWIYRFDQANHVSLLAFIDGQLQRIFDVSCLDDNTDCK
jgi:Protein of unknown function (DUF2845)